MLASDRRSACEQFLDDGFIRVGCSHDRRYGPCRACWLDKLDAFATRMQSEGMLLAADIAEELDTYVAGQIRARASQVGAGVTREGNVEAQHEHHLWLLDHKGAIPTSCPCPAGCYCRELGCERGPE